MAYPDPSKHDAHPEVWAGALFVAAAVTSPPHHCGAGGWSGAQARWWSSPGAAHALACRSGLRAKAVWRAGLRSCRICIRIFWLVGVKIANCLWWERGLPVVGAPVGTTVGRGIGHRHQHRWGLRRGGPWGAEVGCGSGCPAVGGGASASVGARGGGLQWGAAVRCVLIILQGGGVKIPPASRSQA
jgi:hypothetical protein